MEWLPKHRRGVAIRHIPKGVLSPAEQEKCGVLGGALAVVTAQVFLVADLHQDVAVGTKTKERHREHVDHCGATGGETEEESDCVSSNKAVENIHAATTHDFAWVHELGLGGVMRTRKFSGVV